MICEAGSEGEMCGREARFKIIDIVCPFDKDLSAFWVCNKCIKQFIPKNEDNPHYILLKEKTKEGGRFR